MTRTPERAAALLYCAYLRTENAPFIAREVYRTLVKPFPRQSPEVAALRRIAELADTRYERLDHDTICKCGEIAKEIARGVEVSHSRQLDLFASQAQSDMEQSHRASWKTCWNWDGPVVGGYAEIGTPIVSLESGEMEYLYCLRIKMIEVLPDGKWLAEVCDYEPCNGKRVILGICDIWYDVRGPRQ